MSGVLRDSAIYFVIRATNGLVAAGTLFVLTHLLSPLQFGQYALLVAAITFCSTIAYQWLAVSVGRFTAGYRAQPGILLSAARTLFGATSLVLIGLGLCVLGFQAHGADHFAVGAAALCGVVGMGWHNLNLQLANALHRPAAYGWLTIARGVTALAFAWALVWAGLGYAGAVIAVPASCAVAALLAATLLRGAIGTQRGLPRSAALRRELLRYGLPLSLTFVAVMIIDLSDRFLINWLIGPQAVAGYAAAYDLVQQTIVALMNVFFLAGFPRAISAWEADDRAAASAALEHVARLIVFFGGLGVVCIAGLAPVISHVVFGAGIREDSAAVMPVIAVAITLASFRNYYLDALLQLTGNTRGQLYIMVIMAVTNIAANLVLIPMLGVSGAAWGTLCAVVCGIALTWRVGHRQVQVPTVGRHARRGLVITSAVALPVLLITQGRSLEQTLALGIVAAVVYVLICAAVDHCRIRESLGQFWHGARAWSRGA